METGVNQTEVGFFQLYHAAMNLSPVEISTYSPLVLAYIGDGVYDLMMRLWVINPGNTQVNKLHAKCSKLVCATRQAAMAKALIPELKPPELGVLKRGKNTKFHSGAKNATALEYHWATGFEALVGWLFLNEQYERLIFLVRTALEKTGEPFGSGQADMRENHEK